MTNSCGMNGYICPMCASGVCPGCQHDDGDHVAPDGADPVIEHCTQLYVDPLTGEETFCTCVRVQMPAGPLDDAKSR